MTNCKKCGRRSPPVARVPGFCAECIKRHFEEFEVQLVEAHARTRAAFGLPGTPPKTALRASPQPQAETGARYATCNFCVNECDIAPGECGYCGVRFNADGVLVGGTSWANVSWYQDLLPTNCVADWVCAAGSEACYPEYSHSPEIERGYCNLAVFYQACTFDCLFCQNWHFRRVARALEDGIVADGAGSGAAGADGRGGCPDGQATHRTGDYPGAESAARHGAHSAAGGASRRRDVFVARRKTPPRDAITPAELAAAADERTACICYFGGDPAPQMIHSILTARRARGSVAGRARSGRGQCGGAGDAEEVHDSREASWGERHDSRGARQKGAPDGTGRIMRICWETNGSSNPDLLRVATNIALESGGCIKFDLKAWNENLHKALCGVTNSRTLSNFKQTAQYALGVRPEPPPVVASTLLVPGYIDEGEVYHIAKHIASVDRDIPYSLLAFHPQYCMGDLPTTSAAHASACLDAARAAGLTRLRLGNRHLLGADYR